MAEIPNWTPKNPITRNYYSLAGVDFTNDPTTVQKNRSPESVNMYKNYKNNEGQPVETRPGFETVLEMGEEIYGIHFIKDTTLNVLVHAGSKMYLWSDYPNAQDKDEMTLLYSSMAERKSTSFVYNVSATSSEQKTRLFINDGTNYLYWEENTNTLKSVSYKSTQTDIENIAYIPTTSITRTPSGGGSLYQDVNVLTPLRKNSFRGDGTSKTYQLDVTNIDSGYTPTATVNGSTVSISSFNATNGTVTFATAPASPSQNDYADNVIIQFSKENNTYLNRINKCTMSCIYDNRIFFSGNSDFPNALFHSAVNSPDYIPDINYYQDGADNVGINTLMRIGDSLAVIKEDDQQENTVFYHSIKETNETSTTTTTTTSTGSDSETTNTITTTYPAKQGLAGIGCVGQFGARNFLDDPVFISKRGLESITKLNLNLERASEHRSTLIDGNLVNEIDLKNVYLEEWKGYLTILINGHIYLADSRQRYQNNTTGHTEYEWYYWDEIGTYDNEHKEKIANDFKPAVLLKEYDDSLYFGCSNGTVCVFTENKYNDEGRVLFSQWATPLDDFGSNNHVKTTNKKGGVAKLKTIQNSMVKLKEYDDRKKIEKAITKFISNGFDFANLSFKKDDFAFNTGDDCQMKFKIKAKKWGQIQLVFFSDELNKPFGIFNATLEAYMGGYMKAKNNDFEL